MTRYMVSYWHLAGPSGNQCFDTRAQAMEFITGHKPEWKSYSTFTFQGGQVVGELTPYKAPGFNHYSWETPVAV